jgi:hypothetical protein
MWITYTETHELEDIQYHMIDIVDDILNEYGIKTRTDHRRIILVDDQHDKNSQMITPENLKVDDRMIQNIHKHFGKKKFVIIKGGSNGRQLDVPEIINILNHYYGWHKSDNGLLNYIVKKEK